MRTILRFDCKDRECALREQDPQWLEALARHTQSCTECAEELRVWKEISAAAVHLRKSWDSPELWARIERALIEKSRVSRQRQRARALPRLWDTLRLHWQPAVALAALLLVSLSGAWLVLRRSWPVPSPEAQRRLLTEQAIREAEKSDEAYAAAIAMLAKLAEPKVENPTTPLLASFREKLLLLDAAIADCRAQVKQNPGNPQLRQELLSMYQEEQRTLREVVQEE
jgi:hypothetical protein